MQMLWLFFNPSVSYKLQIVYYKNYLLELYISKINVNALISVFESNKLSRKSVTLLSVVKLT